MSEIVDITVGVIQEEITISAVNNIGEITVNAVSNSEEVNITANTNLIQININTAPISIINPQDYDLSQFTNTSSNPFVQQSTLATYVPISRTIKINGVQQDLSADREWNFPIAVWGSITGTLASQTDLQAALDSKVPTSRTLTINGTSYDLSANRSWTISTGITIGTTAITSGVVGRVLFEGVGNVVQESADLFWDNINGRLGLGTSNPTARLQVNGTATIQNGSSRGLTFTPWTLGANIDPVTASNNLYFGRDVAFSNVVFQTGNVLVNTTVDAGYKLDVNGTIRATSAITTDAHAYLNQGVWCDIYRNRFGVEVFRITLTSNNMLIGTTTDVASSLVTMESTTKGFLLPRMTNTQVLAIATPATGLQAYDTTNNKLMVYDATAWRNIATENWVTSQGYLTTQPWVVSGSNIYYSTGNVGIGTSSPTAPLQINTSGLVTALYINTGNDGGFTAQNNGTLAVNRTTQVRLVNGSTIFGANDRTYQLVNIGKGATDADFYVQYWNGANYLERFRIFSTGNVSIGTSTDAGFKLDVNGTLRATQITASSAGGSFNVGSVNVVDFGDGLRIGYSSSVTKITLLTNSGTPRFQVVNSGSILIGTTTEVTSSLFTLESTTRGFLFPRMTTTQKNAIATPATGLVVYDTTLSALSSFNGTVWSTIGGSVAWGSITGTLSAQTDLQLALDAKVPYTGATANVDLGEYELKAGQLSLDITPTGTAAVGTTRWNDSIGSSETTLKGGNVLLKNGVDLVARVVNKVTPNATLLKANYTAVRISGAQGQRLAVEYAQANSDLNSADTIGLVAEDIATNQEGFVITVGELLGINTTGALQSETWADGDVLYLSPTTPGAVTNIKPTGATGHIVVLGYVVYSHAVNGKIYVKIMNGWELDELHNVYINPATLANGDTLIYDSSTSLWKNGVGGGGGGSIIKLASQTLAVGSWSLVGSYYQLTFSNASITTNTRVDFTPNNASYNEVTTCGMLPQVDVTAGSCTFYSLFPPQSNITGEITIFPTI